jgi:hypothetical protein
MPNRIPSRATPYVLPFLGFFCSFQDGGHMFVRNVGEIPPGLSLKIIIFIVISVVTSSPSSYYRDNKESEKTKHAHMKMEINEIATKTNTN